MQKYDLFIFAGEDSSDLLGYNLVKELLSINPTLKILAVAGPLMRKLKIDILMNMEDFHVMGFVDIIFAFVRLIKNFFFLRKKILNYSPKACVFIDYPDFNLRLEKALRKKGYKNKIIHYVSPSVWAWRKNRASFMAKYVDLLITIFPFEKKYFTHTSLDVKYIGHPLSCSLNIQNLKKDYIGIFAGSREKEIIRNLPIQLKAAQKLLLDDSDLKFAISTTSDLIHKIFKDSKLDPKNFIFFPREKNYEYMNKMKMALATSGTINLELALHRVITVVNFAIKPLDLFIAQKILKIDLKFYCIVNIILEEKLFHELYGPNLSVDSLYKTSKKILNDENLQRISKSLFDKLFQSLNQKNPNKNAASLILSNL
ncbi:MAG: Lipid-A-disaccharide synthase [Candidatus Anoxychlamydiales bacterium]|nr:Lipid-A-disaccharide synthase [Candidatus Anoxychlamydiales bacterium]